jgi:abequosyltransferase
MTILSICIPTINQPDRVAILLDALAGQYRSDIEIIIYDESQNRATEEIVEGYTGKFQINYFRRPRGGLDNAVIDFIEIAKGDYIWWVGDDMLLHDVVDRLCGILYNNTDVIFLWLNSKDISSGYDSLCFKEKSLVLFDDRNRLLAYDIGLLGFITATVFRRDFAISGIADARKTVGSAFSCLWIILYVLSQPGKIGIVGDLCFMSWPKPPGEVRWYSQYQVFGINLFKIAAQFSHVFDPVVFRNALSRNLIQVIKAIIVERSMGLRTGFASPDVKISTLLSVYSSYWQLWVLLPILLVPTSLL